MGFWRSPIGPIIPQEVFMRGWIGGVALALAVLTAVIVGLADAQGPRAAHERMPVERPTQDRVASSPDLLAMSHEGPDGRQQITIVDPRQRVMAVYHIDRVNGAVALKSVRNLTWDLQIEDFNSGTPAPRDIRALKEQQR
jgi:hypothetical protein